MSLGFGILTSRLQHGSTEYSSLLVDIPRSSTPHFAPPPQDQSLTASSSSSPYYQQLIQALAQVTAQSPFPIPDTKNKAIVRANEDLEILPIWVVIGVGFDAMQMISGAFMFFAC